MRISRLILTGWATLTLASSAPAVPLLSNGSFETHAPFTGFDGTFVYLTGLNDSWTVAGGGGVASVGAFGTMANRSGNAWGLMQGAGTTSQIFAGLAGSTVSYSFVGQGRDNQPGFGLFEAFIDGVLLYSTQTAQAVALPATGSIFGSLSGSATLNASSTHTPRRRVLPGGAPPGC